jgi:hypothetical protein
MNIEHNQKAIIDAIEHELSLANEFYTPSSMYHSVWFYPLIGVFLFADCVVKYEVIYPMIESKKLVYKGIESHQGELMVRYVLNQ